jgi:phosphopentomutase
VREKRRGRRAVVLVIDGCGVGALPDAPRYGDEGANTLAHLAHALGGLQLPSMQALGLGCVLPLAGVPPSANPVIHGRLHPLGPGKDSTSGHWELMGAVLERPPLSFPDGLPPALLRRLMEAMGRQAICNLPRNGIAAIEQFGAEHLRSGKLILYTSTDSVVQLAAHVERVSEQELYAACEAARAALGGEHAVGRVIARPFRGLEGAFERTDGRRDFTLPPPGRTYLQELYERGIEVHSVGKVFDLFAGVGVSESHPGASNAQALRSATRLLDRLETGMIFVNLIETDQTYGHRKDFEGFHMALREIDARLASWMSRLREDDLIVLTADHGVDLSHPSGDHTREHAPLLAVSGAMLGGSGVPHLRHDGPLAHGGSARRHDGPLADVGASVLLWLTGQRAPELPGEPFTGLCVDA